MGKSTKNKWSMIPKTLSILGRKYKVIVQRDDAMGNDRAGSHSPIYNTIYLNADQHREAMASTLLHEIIEAVDTMQNIGLREHQIRLLETGLYQVLNENKLKF